MQIAANVPATTAAHAALGCACRSATAGAITNAAFAAATTKKPAARNIPDRRPSAPKRAPASTATEPAPSAITVATTRRRWGRAYDVGRLGYVRNSASDAPSRPATSTSPLSHVWYASLSSVRTIMVVGTKTHADYRR